MEAANVILSESGGYYVFAKCSKDGSSGVYYITQEQIKVEPVSDPNNYYFQVGIIGSLHSDDNFRDFITTYGFTRTNGNTITTGKISSVDTETYFDLDNSEIGGKINFKDGLISGDIGIGNVKGVNAGMNGAGSGTNGANQDVDIRLWVGATKENKRSAPFRVQHDGKMFSSEAEIEGNIIVGGSIRSSFVKFTNSSGTWEDPFRDNMVFLQSSTSTSNPFLLADDAAQAGRIITIVHGVWAGSTSGTYTLYSSGTAILASRSGKTGFFIDGYAVKTLKISRQVVRLIGLGDGNVFAGWAVLGITDIVPNYTYGKDIKALAFGTVKGLSSGATITYRAFDIFRSSGKITFSVSRNGTGDYTISFTNIPLASDNYFVILTGIGSTLIKATLVSKTTSSFRVAVSDDSSANDGSFDFMIINKDDWDFQS
jgi:hypothetical protein